MAGNTFEEKIRLYVEATGDKEIGVLAAQLSKLAAGSDKAAAEAQQLATELERLASLQGSIKQFTTLKATMTETAGALDKARQRMAEINAEVDRSSAPTEKLRRQQAQAAQEVTKLSQAYNRQQAELGRTTNALKSAGVDTGNLGTAYADLQARMGQLGERANFATQSMRDAGGASNLLQKGLGKMGVEATTGAEALAGVVTSLGAVAAASAAALAGIAALGGASLLSGAIRSATTLEDALVQVQAVTGASAEELERMKRAAENAAAVTRFSALEAAQGLGELARATGSAETAIAALPATLNLAQSASIGVAEAAGYVTTTLTSFRLGLDQASRVADVFQTEANSTEDTVGGLGQAMSYVAPLAQQLGMSLEDTSAIIGALAKNTFFGSRAGTALQNVFSRMLDPASEFSRTLRAAGIESKNFADVVVALSQDVELADRALLTLDQTAMPAISALVKNGVPAMQELQAAFKSGGGQAARSAAEIGNSTTAAAEQVSKGFDQIRRELVEPLLAPLKDELAELTRQLVEFSQTPEFERIKVAFTSIMETGVEALKRFGETIDWDDLLQAAVGFAEQTAVALDLMLPSVVAVAEAVNGLVDVFSISFNTLQGIINTAVAQISGALAALARGFDALSAPQRRLLEFVGILEESDADFEGFAARMAAAAAHFQKKADESFSAAAQSARELGEDITNAASAATKGTTDLGEASGKAAQALDAVREAADGAAAAQERQGDSAAQAAAQTEAAAGRMALTAEQVRNAFADLGIKAQDDLQRSADAAKRNFELIQRAAQEGKASAEDVRRAFAAYAEAQRSAVADSDASKKVRVDSELAVKAAVLGVADAFDRQGASGAAAGQQIARGASAASSALQQASSGVQSYSDSVEWLSNKTEEAGQKSAQAAPKLQQFGLAASSVSEDFTRAAMAINKYANSVDNTTWRNELNRLTQEYGAQKDAIEAQMAALDRQMAQYDELAGRVEQLRAQYKYLGEDQLRALAEKEKQVADLARREQEHLQRQQAEAAKRTIAADQTAGASLTKRSGEIAAAANEAAAAIERAAAASESVARSARPAATAGRDEIVLRVVSDQPSGGVPLRLSPSDLQGIASAVLRLIQQSRGLTS